MNNRFQDLRNIRDRKEIELLKSHKLCYYVAEKSNLNRSQLSERLKDSNVDSLRTHLKRNFTNMEIMDAIFCTFDTTLHISSSGLPYANDTIKTMLHRLHLSKYDFMKIEKSTEDLFMIKSGYNAADDSESHELLHEFFVASLFTNRLRRIIPNYAYVFGGFKLSSSDCSINDEGVMICSVDTDKEVDYIFYEKIDGDSMGIALKTCTIDEYLSWMIQIVLALETGVIHFGFTHNNLHTDNVLIRPINDIGNDWLFEFELEGSYMEMLETDINKKSFYYIPYVHNNKTWLVRATSIATIWNYELAHVKNYDDRNNIVKSRGEHFGPIGYQGMGIYERECRPFYDLYKLLMWSLKILHKYNKEVFLEARKLSKFFGYYRNDQLLEVLFSEEKLSYIYSTTISDSERIRSLADFIGLMNLEFEQMADIMIPKEEFNYDQDKIKCEGFCPINGYTKQDETPKESIFEDVNFINERCRGLAKRKSEIQKLCDVEKSECKIANLEYSNYFDMIDSRKEQIRDMHFRKIEDLANQINEKLYINEIDASKYKSETGFKIPNSRIAYFYRSHKEIRTELGVLKQYLNDLEEFDTRFDVKSSKQFDKTTMVNSEIGLYLDSISEEEIIKMLKS